MVTSAFVGAGIVAIGAATNLPDAKAVNPTVLADLENASVNANELSLRATDSARASRADGRDTKASKRTEAEIAAEIWLLPLDEYTFTTPYRLRFNKLHSGIDLRAPEGTPYKAVHAGVVKAAGYNGAYGFAVTVAHPDGTETVYAHSSEVLVQAGQSVKAGDVIGKVGSTGYSFGPHLHLEFHVAGAPIDPIPALRERGVDIQLQVESTYGNLAAS